MTEEQVFKWQKRRDEAKSIEDPVAREKALDIVYDLKDDMQLDCQRRMADRIKELLNSNREQREDILEIRGSVKSLKTEFDKREDMLKEDHAVVQEIRDHKLRAHGIWLAIKILGILFLVGGSSFVTWLLTAVNKVRGIQ